MHNISDKTIVTYTFIPYAGTFKATYVYAQNLKVIL